MVGFLDERMPLRFWRKIRQDGECWTWLAYTDEDGYGYYWDKGKGRKPHRVALGLVEKLTPGLEVDHKCRNRACVNPAHLEQVTRKVNAERSAEARLACPAGHLYTPKNTYYRRSRNKRECRECISIRNKRRYL